MKSLKLMEFLKSLEIEYVDEVSDFQIKINNLKLNDFKIWVLKLYFFNIFYLECTKNKKYSKIDYDYLSEKWEKCLNIETSNEKLNEFFETYKPSFQIDNIINQFEKYFNKEILFQIDKSFYVSSGLHKIWENAIFDIFNKEIKKSRKYKLYILSNLSNP